jgi:hypothetical protein
MPDTDLPVYDVPDTEERVAYVLPETDSNWKSLIQGRLSSALASVGVLGVGIYALLTQAVDDVGLGLNEVESLLAAAFVAWGGISAAVSKWKENLRTDLVKRMFAEED